MVKCPNCGRDGGEPEKTWTYGPFEVSVYSCNCGTKFRDYTRQGRHSFMLKLEKGKGYVRV